jgi:hypothetical protein
VETLAGGFVLWIFCESLMTPADLTLPTARANPLAVLSPRRRTGARVEPWISGVTAVKGIKILRSHNRWESYYRYLNVFFVETERMEIG